MLFIAQPALTAVPTSVEVSIAEGLQDVVHGSHVEDKPQLGDTHGDQAEHEDRTQDTLHEGLGCGHTGGETD